MQWEAKLGGHISNWHNEGSAYLKLYWISYISCTALGQNVTLLNFKGVSVYKPHNVLFVIHEIWKISQILWITYGT